MFPRVVLGGFILRGCFVADASEEAVPVSAGIVL